MSFNAKNLTYDANEPSFLRKLKSEYGAVDSFRHKRPITRPKRLNNDDEDDEPTYVDETTRNTISKIEFEALQNGENCSLSRNGKDAELSKNIRNLENVAQEIDSDTPTQKQQLAAIGVPVKRKAVKVVGQDEEEVGAKSKGKAKTKEKSLAKKAKKVKLSFDDG